jgi:hypothetical protein
MVANLPVLHVGLTTNPSSTPEAIVLHGRQVIVEHQPPPLRGMFCIFVDKFFKPHLER